MKLSKSIFTSKNSWRRLVSGRFHGNSYMSNIDHLNQIYFCEMYLVHSLYLLLSIKDFGPTEFDSLAFLACSRTHAYVWFDTPWNKVSNKMISGKEKKIDLCRYLIRVKAASPSGVWIRYSSSVLCKSMTNKACFSRQTKIAHKLKTKKVTAAFVGQN